jgi:acyl-[acyl carrier protein]--UDP-N-acetylglucosamine O-acyltransferase
MARASPLSRSPSYKYAGYNNPAAHQNLALLSPAGLDFQPCPAVHQFVHIGNNAMIGGMSGVESNIIPYGLYTGIRSNLRGLNIIGLKRKGLDTKSISEINLIFKKIFNNNLSDNEKQIEEINEIINFISLNYKRGISKFINE